MNDEILQVEASLQAEDTRFSHLHGPVADVVMLGGASVLAFLLLLLWSPSTSQTVVLGGVMMVLANFVNHPHFAHSYQIFYGSWTELRSVVMPLELRRRWYLAGVILPISLALWLFLGLVFWHRGESWPLAVSINLLGALVGWHYVKQGFGMAMMDAALKKRFWAARARRAMLWNAYACWAAAWVLINSTGAGSGYWGLFGLSLVVPPTLIAVVCGVAAVSSVWVGLEVYRTLTYWRVQNKLPYRAMPLSGLVAYLITLYLWTVFAWAYPAYLIVIPFFHSLQYLTVIWSYKRNEFDDREAKPRSLVQFWLVGVLLGALGFWIVPVLIDYFWTGYVPYWGDMTQPALMLASVWIFINVHHYLIDNVLWRQGNPKVNKYLFGAPGAEGEHQRKKVSAA